MGKPRRVRIPRPVSPTHLLIQGNRDYIVALRRTLAEALRAGTATLPNEDPDGDDVVTTIICSRRIGRQVGFVVESAPAGE